MTLRSMWQHLGLRVQIYRRCRSVYTASAPRIIARGFVFSQNKSSLWDNELIQIEGEWDYGFIYYRETEM